MRLARNVHLVRVTEFRNMPAFGGEQEPTIRVVGVRPVIRKRWALVWNPTPPSIWNRSARLWKRLTEGE